MTVEKLLEKYRTPGSEDSDGEGSGAYGLSRTDRDRVPMLELRKKDGTILAIPYTMIEQMRYDPDEGITLHACGREIRIAGRHLNTNSDTSGLFTSLARHKVIWISEQSQGSSLQASANTTIVESIAW